MLKGHVFSKQLFGNPIFALFINTFLNGKDGISDNYKNGMALSYSGTDITIQSGAVCIQGRFVEEDTYSTISAGNDVAFCKLVIEIDLDQQNTESELNQVNYKIIKGSNAYPNLTKTNIVKNNAGIYQYELARFKTTGNEITDFQDMRTFLDFNSIYDEIEAHIEAIDAGSVHVKKVGDTMTGKLYANGGVEGDVTGNCTGSSGSCTGNAATATKLQDQRKINGTNFDGSRDITTSKWGTSRKIAISGAVSGNANVDGSGDVTIDVSQANIAILTGNVIPDSDSYQIKLNLPEGYSNSNCVVISCGISEDILAYNNNFYFDFIGSSPLQRTIEISGNRLYITVNGAKEAYVRYKVVLMKIT